MSKILYSRLFLAKFATVRQTREKSMEKYSYIIGCISVLSFFNLQANVWMPVLFAEPCFYSIFSIAALLIGFGIELFFMKFLMSNVGFFKIVTGTFVMNSGSAIVGFLGGVVFHFMAWYVRSAVEISFGIGTPDIPLPVWNIFLYALLFLIAMIVLNVMVEGVIAIWLFPKINRNKLLKLLYLSNTLSVVLSISIMSFKIVTGRLPADTMQQTFEKMEQEDIRNY